VTEKNAGACTRASRVIRARPEEIYEAFMNPASRRLAGTERRPSELLPNCASNRMVRDNLSGTRRFCLHLPNAPSGAQSHCHDREASGPGGHLPGGSLRSFRPRYTSHWYSGFQCTADCHLRGR
jgi:hypothetical protein